MKSNSSNDRIAAALGALEGWLETMHGPGGYYGPVVGMRGTAMSWCGPAHDWRWEGLIEGWVARHRSTSNPVFLDRIEQAWRDLQDAQLADGAFRNSCFEHNPCEGGMPHEPAVIAAVLRAARYLREQGRAWPEGAARMTERFVEERLVKALWNKTLRTFNNWLQSDFDVYAPPAVASVIETLYAYGDLTGTPQRWDPYIAGAAASLLKSQIPTGPLAGAFPVSSTDRASASPSLAARCMPALALLAERTGDLRFRDACDRLAEFLHGAMTAEGGFACMRYAGRPDRTLPLYTGAAAGALRAMSRAGRLDAPQRGAHLDWLLARQSPAGGFDTAVGFGTGRRRCPPDWRDALPVCGWSAQVYAWLADLAGGAAPGPAVLPSVCREVMVRGRRAQMTEDADTLAVQDRAEPLYRWRKRTVWPEVCLL